MSKLAKVAGGTLALFAASTLVVSIAWADTPATVDPAKVQSGLPAISKLLQLMDTDNNGKVSKAEFMRFMEAEFDLADLNHDQELDPKELQAFVQGLSHPKRGPGR
jgi:hypothetical protein